MRLEEFLIELRELLRRESDITPEMRLRDMEEWDSMAIMEMISWFSTRFGLELTFDHFRRLDTVADLAALCSQIEQ